MTAPDPLAPRSDQELVVLALAGDERAYRSIIQRYERPIFSMIYRMVKDKTLAEDLAQETFIKGFQALATYLAEFKFSSWIFKIANNVTIDRLRKREVPTVPIEGAPDAMTADRMAATSIQIADPGESPLQQVVSKELGSAIERAIGDLRPEYRYCIMLRHVEDCSYEEIADIMGLPLGTVKTYIHRARAELMDSLKEEHE